MTRAGWTARVYAGGPLLERVGAGPAGFGGEPAGAPCSLGSFGVGEACFTTLLGLMLNVNVRRPEVDAWVVFPSEWVREFM